ncbi:MAG: hypothetical protein NUW02_02140 [Candidatus Campbellbacteria bacterium]|nr:hypothetical protein [Candidatus Campbellbacteria bacterium]
MNTKLQKQSIQISVRDILVSRLNVLEGRLAEYEVKFPTANFTEAKARFHDAETVLRNFNAKPKSEDKNLVDYNLIKGDKAMIAAILQVVAIEDNEKQPEKSKSTEVKVATGSFVGDAPAVKIIPPDSTSLLLFTSAEAKAILKDGETQKRLTRVSVVRGKTVIDSSKRGRKAATK